MYTLNKLPLFSFDFPLGMTPMDQPLLVDKKETKRPQRREKERKKSRGADIKGYLNTIILVALVVMHHDTLSAIFSNLRGKIMAVEYCFVK